MQVWPRSGGLFAPRHHHFTGSHGFDDVELGKHRDRGVSFITLSRDHNNDAGRGEVDRFAIEVFTNLKNLRAIRGSAGDFDHQQFANHRVITGVFETMDHINQFVHLFDDLLESVRIAYNADGHARKASVATLGHDEAVDVESATCKDLANAHQYAGAVVDKYREGVHRLLL